MTLPEDAISDEAYNKLQNECLELRLNLKLLYGEVHRLTDDLLNSKLLNLKLQETLNAKSRLDTSEQQGN